MNNRSIAILAIGLAALHSFHIRSGEKGFAAVAITKKESFDICRWVNGGLQEYHIPVMNEKEMQATALLYNQVKRFVVTDAMTKCLCIPKKSNDLSVTISRNDKEFRDITKEYKVLPGTNAEHNSQYVILRNRKDRDELIMALTALSMLQNNNGIAELEIKNAESILLNTLNYKVKNIAENIGQKKEENEGWEVVRKKK